MDGKELGKRYLYPVSAEDDRDACGGSYGETGITLRQHFAGLAMAAFVASFRHGNEALNVDGVAKISVMQADALLAELPKDPTHEQA